MLIDNPTSFFLSVAACPVSKEPVEWDGNCFVSTSGFVYPNGDLRVGLDYSEDWAKGQADYEAWQHRRIVQWERVPNYYRLVDDETVDVYAAINISGRVLDVGGGFGSLLKQANLDPSTYVSIDAFPFRWAEFVAYRNFATHYRECANACRAPAFAEFLPIRTGSIDVVHMRSCLDHFANPLLALQEARRVLVRGGRLVIGLSLEGAYKKNNARAYDKLKAFIKQNTITRELYEFFFDHHIFHPTHAAVIELVRRSGFSPLKEHWQAGYHNVLYLEAQRLPTTSMAKQ